MQLRADSQKALERFVRRVAEAQLVWALHGPTGVIPCESQDGDSDVLPFWSDAAYARRAQADFPETEVISIPLFDFLFRWLPGMKDDGVLAGPNWSAQLAGLELDPDELQQQLFDALSDADRAAIVARLED